MDIIGRSAPNAGRVPPERLKKMFGNARKRCHATPIVTFRAITIAHVIEMMIFTRAMSETATSLFVSPLPSACDTGAAQVGNGK